jgi:hypothetical protein
MAHVSERWAEARICATATVGGLPSDPRTMRPDNGWGIMSQCLNDISTVTMLRASG